MHECKHENDISDIRADIREVRSDVKKILEWKGMIFGGLVVISTVVSIVVSVAIEYAKKEEKPNDRYIESYDAGRPYGTTYDAGSTGG